MVLEGSVTHRKQFSSECMTWWLPMRSKHPEQRMFCPDPEIKEVTKNSVQIKIHTMGRPFSSLTTNLSTVVSTSSAPLTSRARWFSVLGCVHAVMCAHIPGYLPPPPLLRILHRKECLSPDSNHVSPGAC